MRQIILIACLFLFVACNPDNSNDGQRIQVDGGALAETIPYSPGDPFIETIKKSEYFKMSGLEDKVIETSNGTVISIPKAAFRDAKGNIVEEEVEIEIKDIQSFEEQFNANIMSAPGQNILLDGGAIYLNATSNGAQLQLNDDSPIYVELNQAYDPDLLIFEGIRNDAGEMQWLNPQEPERIIMSVPLSDLDFLPVGVEDLVKGSIPFGDFTEATADLIDSLYYSLATFAISAQEPMALPDSVPNNLISSADTLVDYTSVETAREEPCAAINPASIKAIRDPKFQSTFIASRQFETRLQALHKARSQEGLDIYISNLTKKLYECDEMVATLFEKGSESQLQFQSFAEEKWSTVEEATDAIQSLSKYYKKQLAAIEKELLDNRKEYAEQVKQDNEQAQKKVKEYKIILEKRQRYRLKRHGFKLVKTGWTAPAKVILEPMTIEITVEQGSEYDRVHVYTVDPTIKSIFAWQSADKIHFQYAFPDDCILVYKKGIQVKALVVAYKGEQGYMDLQNIEVTNKIEIDFKPTPSSRSEITRSISNLENGHEKFNKVSVDLAYQEFFYEENIRQNKMQETQNVMLHLYQVVYGCATESLSE